MNCLIAITANLVGMLVIYSLLAFALARLSWHHRGTLPVLAAIVVAGQFWLIPTLIVRNSSCLAFASCSLLFCNWLISGFSIIILAQAVRRVPRQLEDSARLDGCGWFGTYWHILLPLVSRELWLIGFLTLMGTLMLVVVPPIRTFDPGFAETWLAWSLSVLPPGWLGPISSVGLMMGVSLVATLPMIVVFFFSKRYLSHTPEPGGTGSVPSTQ